MFFNSIKEINRSVKESQTFTIKNYWRSQNLDFLGKKIWINALALKSKNTQGIFGDKFILALSSSAVFLLQNSLSNFLKLFSSGDKRLLWGFLQK